MKTIRLFFCGALLLFIGSASLSAQTNLVLNGGFEEVDANGRPIGWYDGYNSDTKTYVSEFDTISTSDFKEGKQSGFFGPNPIWSRVNIYPSMQARSYDIPVKLGTGHTYKLSFWYKQGSKFNETGDTYNMAWGSSFKSIETKTPADIRTKLSETLDAIEGEWLFAELNGIYSVKRYETGADVSTFNFRVLGNNCEFWLDDVKMVEEVPETTTNLIPNGNFEQVDANGKPTGWGDNYAENYESVVSKFNTSDATDFKEGIKSGYFTYDPTYNLENVVPSISAMNWIKDIPANKTYNISFWYKVSDRLNQSYSNHEPFLNLAGSSFYNGLSSENHAILSTNLDLIAGEWLFGEYKGIKSTTATEDFIIGFNSDNCNFWLDDVQMVEATGTGINQVKADTKLPVYVSEGILYVGGTTAGETVSVYSITGQTLKSEKAQSTTTKIAGLSGGQVYIVRSGGKSAKVVL